MRKASLSAFAGHIYLAGEEDHDAEANADREDDKGESSDSSSSTSGSPRLSARGSGLTQTPPWPQSYRQSMDIYSNMASPGFLSSSINRLSSSYLSTSFRRHTSDKLSPLTSSLLPSKEEKPELATSEQFPVVTRKYSSAKVVEHDKMPFGCSTTQGTLNGLNVLCGVGVLSTPYAVKEGGWLSLGFLVLFAIVCLYTGLLLRRCLDSHDGLETYPDIGQAAFGIPGRLITAIILYVELYACCVEFLILEGDNLSAIFPNAYLSYNGVTLTPTELFVIATAMLVLPTVWLRNLSLLSYVSAGGVIASIMVVLCVFWVGVVDGVGFHKSGPLLNFVNLPVSIGLYGFCYSGHSVYPNIYSSLKDRSKFPLILLTSFTICTAMYGGMAVMGFKMFGDMTESQISLNLPDQFLASKIAVWTTIVNPFTKYALTVTPIALSLEELLPSLDDSFKGYWFSVTIRTVLVISTVCVALIIPFFAYVMAFIGSLLSMLVCLILPATFYLKIVGNKVTTIEKLSCMAIIIVGVVCAIAGTFSSLVEIIESY